VVLVKWIITKLPRWQVFFNENKGALYDAVRFAENAIPDNTPNKAAQRADAALKFILANSPDAKGEKKATVRLAIDEAHAKLQEKKNGNGNGNGHDKKDEPKKEDKTT
jgi:hypothetical protein